MNRREFIKCAALAAVSPLLSNLPVPHSDLLDWADSSASIPMQIRAMKQGMMASGYVPTKLFIGNETANILRKNCPELLAECVVYGDGAYVDGKLMPFMPEGTVVAMA